MVLVLQVVNTIIIIMSSSSSTQHLAEFSVWYLPAVTNNSLLLSSKHYCSVVCYLTNC